MKPASIVLTCEHGGNRVPPEVQARFLGAKAQQELTSHRGWDPGALPIARRLAARLRCPLVACQVSRLVVDANRSRHHRALFSERTRSLARAERDRLLEKYWIPHRRRVTQILDAEIEAGCFVLHLGIHSFVPRLHGRTRQLEVGILYDPGRRAERAWARHLRRSFADVMPEARVRMNQPYRGVADGLVTELRKTRSDAVYAGLEIEVNQRLSTTRVGRARVTEALHHALRSLPADPELQG